jgi:predicted nucleotidyltransferase
VERQQNEVIMYSSFAKLFPNSTVVDILAYFFLHPDEEVHQSALVSATSKALVQVQRALKRLETVGLIGKTKRGNRVYYHANADHPAFSEMKNAFFKTVLIGDTLRKSLKTLRNKIQCVFIYGSLAKGEETLRSDIDLFIIGNLSIKDTAKFLSEVSHEIGREINPSVYPCREFRQKLKQRNPFIIEVWNGPKIWLIGNERECQKMAS